MEGVELLPRDRNLDDNGEPRLERINSVIGRRSRLSEMRRQRLQQRRNNPRSDVAYLSDEDQNRLAF